MVEEVRAVGYPASNPASIDSGVELVVFDSRFIATAPKENNATMPRLPVSKPLSSFEAYLYTSSFQCIPHPYVDHSAIGQ